MVAMCVAPTYYALAAATAMCDVVLPHWDSACCGQQFCSTNIAMVKLGKLGSYLAQRPNHQQRRGSTMRTAGDSIPPTNRASKKRLPGDADTSEDWTPPDAHGARC